MSIKIIWQGHMSHVRTFKRLFMKKEFWRKNHTSACNRAMAFQGGNSQRVILTLKWARVNKPYILYIKDTATPGQYPSADAAPTPTIRYVLAWAETGKGDFYL